MIIEQFSRCHYVRDGQTNGRRSQRRSPFLLRKQRTLNVTSGCALSERHKLPPAVTATPEISGLVHVHRRFGKTLVWHMSRARSVEALSLKLGWKHGSPLRGPPRCIMRPAATFVNCVYGIKNYTVNQVVSHTTYCYFSTCGPRNSPQSLHSN
jgi:hypothetical protein